MTWLHSGLRCVSTVMRWLSVVVRTRWVMRDALVWFVNHLSSRGKAIEPGEFVTTGVCAGPVTVKPGQSVIARFDGYGEVNLRLTGED